MPGVWYIENAGTVDWEARRRELDEIAAWGRQHQAGGYDCIVGVSGGKDSTRQAFYVRDELGLKPLLVCCSYPPEQLADRGPDNLSNLIERGFDLHFVSPAPQSWKQMMHCGTHVSTARNRVCTVRIVLYSGILWQSSPVLRHLLCNGNSKFA